MKKINTAFIMVFFIIIFPVFLYAYRWPFDDKIGPHPINSGMGDYRETKRFHSAVDTNPKGYQGNTAIGQPIYAISDGYARLEFNKKRFTGDDETVQILPFAYTHIKVLVDDKSKVTAGQQIAEFKKLGDYPAHLHLTEYPFIPIDSAEPAGIINPLRVGGLDNYVDKDAPEIQEIKSLTEPFLFYKDPGDTSSNYPLKYNSIYGKVDILAKGKDNQSLGDGIIAIYKIGFKIGKSDGTEAFSGSSNIFPIIFDKIAAKSLITDAPLISDVDSSILYNIESPCISTQSTFCYWITNKIERDFISDKGKVTNSFWNTKAKKSGTYDSSEDALVNSETLTPDKKYKVTVFGYDIKGNGGINIGKTVEVLIDNYRPYVQRVKIEYDVKTEYERKWTVDGSNLSSSGPTTKRILLPGKYTITIEFSEPVQNPSLTIDTFGTIALTSSEAANEKKKWTGKLEIPSGYAGGHDGLRTMTIDAADLAGNKLVNITSGTTQINPATQLTRDTSDKMQGTGGVDTLHQFEVLIVLIDDYLYLDGGACIIETNVGGQRVLPRIVSSTSGNCGSVEDFNFPLTADTDAEMTVNAKTYLMFKLTNPNNSPVTIKSIAQVENSTTQGGDVNFCFGEFGGSLICSTSESITFGKEGEIYTTLQPNSSVYSIPVKAYYKADEQYIGFQNKIITLNMTLTKQEGGSIKLDVPVNIISALGPYLQSDPYFVSEPTPNGNFDIEPGEEVKIYLRISNRSSQRDFYDVHVALDKESRTSCIDIQQQTLSAGNISKNGVSNVGPYTIRISPTCQMTTDWLKTYIYAKQSSTSSEYDYISGDIPFRITLKTGVLLPPTELDVKNPKSGSSLELKWKAGSESNISYNIFRSTSEEGAFTKIINTKETTYVDTNNGVGLENYQKYCYKIQAEDTSQRTSNFSDIKCAIPTLSPSPPSNIYAAPNNQSAMIGWEAASTNADGSTLTDLAGYNIYRSTISGVYTIPINTTPVTDTLKNYIYTDTNLTNGQTYYYVVTAVNNKGAESVYSKEVSVMPQKPTTSITLNKGWNLVGISALTTESIQTLFGGRQALRIQGDEIEEIKDGKREKLLKPQYYGQYMPPPSTGLEPQYAGQCGIDDPKPGSAFWVYSNTTMELPLYGSAITIEKDGVGQPYYAIQLDKGWNMIASPYTYTSIPWSSGFTIGIQESVGASFVPLPIAINWGWIEEKLYSSFMQEKPLILEEEMDIRGIDSELGYPISLGLTAITAGLEYTYSLLEPYMKLSEQEKTIVQVTSNIFIRKDGSEPVILQQALRNGWITITRYFESFKPLSINESLESWKGYFLKTNKTGMYLVFMPFGPRPIEVTKSTFNRTDCKGPLVIPKSEPRAEIAIVPTITGTTGSTPTNTVGLKQGSMIDAAIYVDKVEKLGLASMRITYDDSVIVPWDVVNNQPATGTITTLQGDLDVMLLGGVGGSVLLAQGDISDEPPSGKVYLGSIPFKVVGTGKTRIDVDTAGYGNPALQATTPLMIIGSVNDIPVEYVPIVKPVEVITDGITDKKAPVITDRSPATGALVNGLQPVVSVSVVDDETGVDIAKTVAYIDGARLTGCEMDLKLDRVLCKASTDLSEGEHIASIFVVDYAGNATTTSWNFRVIDDQTAPTINAIYPTQDELVTEANPLFSFQVDEDKTDIDWDSAVVLMNNVGAGSKPALSFAPVEWASIVQSIGGITYSELQIREYSQWSQNRSNTVTALQNLEDGAHEIVLGISDIVGNRATTTVEFTVDTGRPEILNYSVEPKVFCVPTQERRNEGGIERRNEGCGGTKLYFETLDESRANIGIYATGTVINDECIHTGDGCPEAARHFFIDELVMPEKALTTETQSAQSTQSEMLPAKISFSWQGERDDGTFAGEGNYKWVVWLESPIGLVYATETAIILDNTPPVVNITSPVDGGFATLGCTDFTKYTSRTHSKGL